MSRLEAIKQVKFIKLFPEKCANPFNVGMGRENQQHGKFNTNEAKLLVELCPKVDSQTTSSFQIRDLS